MTICPIAIAVGCKKCPAFKFCLLTTVLGDQKKEEEPTTKVWEESFPPEKNNNEESWGHWTDEEYLDEVFEDDPICKRCGKGKEDHKVITVMAKKFADCISNPIHGTDLPPES